MSMVEADCPVCRRIVGVKDNVLKTHDKHPPQRMVCPGSKGNLWQLEAAYRRGVQDAEEEARLHLEEVARSPEKDE